MDRSNIDNSWNREKLVFDAVYRSLAGKINQLLLPVKWSLNQFLVLLFAIRIIMKSDVSTPVYINSETVRMFSFVCHFSWLFELHTIKQGICLMIILRVEVVDWFYPPSYDKPQPIPVFPISWIIYIRAVSESKSLNAFFAMKHFENLNFFLKGHWTILQRSF